MSRKNVSNTVVYKLCMAYGLIGASIALLFPENLTKYFPDVEFVLNFFGEIIPSVNGASAHSFHPNTTKIFVLIMLALYPFFIWKIFLAIKSSPVIINARSVFCMIIGVPIFVWISIYFPIFFSAPDTGLLSYSKGRGSAFYTLAMHYRLGLAFFGSAGFVGGAAMLAAVLKIFSCLFSSNFVRN